MAAPTFPVTADLVEGTGTRAFTAVTTTAGDYIVVEAIGEDGAAANILNLTPSATGLTFTKGPDVGAASDTRNQKWTASDSAGGSRTVTVTPSPSTTLRWRARLTVVRGSGGPGVSGASATAQTVSVTRQGANSAMFMAVGDWSTGAVGSPVWTPGGATTASQQGVGATYIFGRWDDSGAVATVAHGISTPAYTTPAVTVLEMLGSAATTVNGTASLAGAGTLTATATVLVPGTASLAGAGTVAASPTVIVPGTATLAGVGILSAASGSTVSGTASLAGAGTLSATALTGSSGTASLTATGTLTAAATVRVPATAVLTGAGSLTATAGVTVSGTASLVGAGVLTAGIVGIPGSMTLVTAGARIGSTSTSGRIGPASGGARIGPATASARLNSTTSGGVA